MRPLVIVLICLTALSVVAGVVMASSIIGTVSVGATVNIIAPPEPDVDQDRCVGEKDLLLVASNIGEDEPSPRGLTWTTTAGWTFWTPHSSAKRTSGDGPCP